ncbi:MAG: hypothetical protein IKE18_11200 [Oscillospiraceae bacterium]|nr:hypothetical protein [Oscillospiraceae bacterium]MBR2807327.1 hypothetical protein [Oscillospiraceae bacterium]
MFALMFFIIAFIFLAPFWLAFGILTGIIGIIGAATGTDVRPEFFSYSVYTKKDLKAAESEAYRRGYLEGYEEGFDDGDCR